MFLLTGQVDSSKSTISGHILYKCGFFDSLPPEDRRTYEKYLTNIETSSVKSKWSILMDLLDGEILNNKTKTKEFNLCNFKYKDIPMTLIDTPGHQLYIRNLMEALFHFQNLDIICLVISCIPAEFSESFERGTVKEDLMLGRSIGCKSLIVLWSKVDVATPTEEMKVMLSAFTKQLGFKSVDEVLVSGYRGDGLDRFLELVSSKMTSKPENESDSKAEQSTASKILVKGMFFPSTILVTSGLQCVMHHKSGEYEVEVDRVKDFKSKKDLKIVPATTPVLFTLLLQKPITFDTLTVKVVFRTKNSTIGFGSICKGISD